MVQAAGEGSRRAYVPVRVAGRPINLLVDTGAFQSVLPADFARESKLRRRAAPEGVFMVDAHGNRASLVYLDRVPVQFEGEAAGGTLDFVTSGSGDNDMALLAPQDLVRRGWVVVIDYGAEELRYEEEKAALQRLRQQGPVQELAYGTCDLLSDAHRIVAATVNGVPVKMGIDTGADRTILARNNAALPSMLRAEGDRGETRGVVSVGQALAVPDVPVVLAGASFRVAVLVSPTSSSCGEGVLGGDLLQHCALAWGWSSVWVSCREPAAGLAR